ncbi:hypothetical protein DJ531_13090, partial [Sulfolobus sp. A20-N-F6]
SFGGNSFYLPIQLPSDYAFQLTFTISALAGLMMAIIGSMTRDIRIGKMRVGISSNMGEK